MEIEHFALNVKDPRAMAQLYVKSLDMRVVRRVDDPIPPSLLLQVEVR